nr:hypothetical protein [Ohessyouella blattaphilus]
MHLTRPQSKKHPPMPRGDRAAQFAPFAALTGHEESIKETARLTTHRIELEESDQERLNETLRKALAFIQEGPFLTITYFVPDEKKAGGAYQTVAGRLKKYKEYEQVLVLEGEEEIEIKEVVAIEEGEG